MDTVLFVSALFKILFALGAVELAIVILRRLDKRLGLDWKEHVLVVLKTDAMALAVYFGARFIGVAILVGHVIS